MTSEAAAEVIRDALGAAMTGDGNRAADLIAQLGMDSDAARMLGVCYAIAEAGHKALRVCFGDAAPDPANGDAWVIEQLEDGALDDPVQAFATRFLIAYCNGDRIDAQAHYEAALQAGPEVFVHGVCQLLIDVAGLANAASELEQQE
ncbi:hypothetical protein DI272_19185 [Streptomyces sp. Act143]|uniref:hypothetical protein n=1 Tax=Streptomyces sp. Act143 TaxID=2200760 RepID=UPI000D68117F|nr:hypothetical protein [Streptomyces sp. Act143]PWI16055.1 hypothetical protein DI272_19185 [Streptomyces sp. Act143]